MAFSKRTGIANSYLSELLRWQKRPTLDMIDRVTAATNGEITANHFQRAVLDEKSNPSKDN